MRSLFFCAFAALALAAHGCTSYDRPQEPIGSREMWVTETLQRASIEKAIIVQRTIFPYHFIEDSAVLNELGVRDLGVLAAHLAEQSGELNVRRGDAPEELYHDRVQQVVQVLADMGISEGAIRIVDGAPGGNGVTSWRMIQILDGESTQSETSASTGASSSASSGGMEKQ